MEVKYTVVIPPINDFPTYKDRYINRGNDINFIISIDYNWGKWIQDIIKKSSVNKTVIILPEDGCLQSYIEGCKNI